MGRRRIVKDQAGIQVVKKRLADGSTAVYRYHTLTRTRIFSEPGSDAFAAEMEALRASQKLSPPETVYFVLATTLNLIKIGITNDMSRRMVSLRTACPDQIKLLGSIAAGGRTLEAELHERFAAARSHGEWFRRVPELEAYIRQEALAA